MHRIDAVEPFVAMQELRQPFSFSQRTCSSRMVCLVRVTADDGTYGWGEAYAPAPVAAAGIRAVAPHIIGQDAMREGAIWSMLYRQTLDHARSGVLMAAISAIDVALHDLKGKRLGLPVAELLGGRLRSDVRVYATGMYFTDDHEADTPQADRLAEEAFSYVREGFTAVKMKVGRSLAEDRANITAVREAIGRDVELMVDANHAYDLSEAFGLAEDLQRIGVSWFEEPLSPEDYRGYAELRRRITVPIAGGECEYLTFGFRRLFEAGSVDIAQPDICASGGLSETRRIADLARCHLVNVTPHCWGTGVAMAAAVHLVSTLDPVPGRMIERSLPLEMDRTENPLRDILTKPAFTQRDGYVRVPESPGLGVDVDTECLERFEARESHLDATAGVTQ